MGNWKRCHLLIFGLLSAMILVPTSSNAANRKNALSLTVQFMEKASRIEMSSQKMKIELNGKPKSFPIETGKAFKGAKVILTARPVQINSEPGYYWLEATLMDSAGKSIAYGTSTVFGWKFSFGIGLQSSSDPKQELVLMIDSISTDEK